MDQKRSDWLSVKYKFFFLKKNSVVEYFEEIVHSCSSTHLDPKC